jgi:hypothetical protein
VHAQETDSDVASTGEQVFRRFASLCRGQKAACDAAFRFGALVGADAAMRCALADDRIACFKTTMNSQEFMEGEREAITGQTDPKNEGERLSGNKSREVRTRAGVRGRFGAALFLWEARSKRSLFARRPPRSLSKRTANRAAITP